MYYRTDQIRTDAGVPVGTTGQIGYMTELIRYRSTRRYYRTYTGTELIRYRSTRRYYRTDKIRTYSDTELIRDRSTHRYYRAYTDTGVPVGTTELIQVQEYP